jgi:hypothetical protein
MTELYLGVMDALWAMTPGLPIFFVEGGGQGAYKGARFFCLRLSGSVGGGGCCSCGGRGPRGVPPGVTLLNLPLSGD